MIVIGHTGGLIAAFNTADPEHPATRRALDTASLLVVSPFTLTEIHQVATSRANRQAADKVTAAIVKRADPARAVIAATTPQLVRDALAVRSRYQGLDLDLADAVAVVLAAEYDTDTVLTIDRRDFRAMRPIGGRHKAFRLLPDDL